MINAPGHDAIMAKLMNELPDQAPMIDLPKTCPICGGPEHEPKRVWDITIRACPKIPDGWYVPA